MLPLLTEASLIARSWMRRIGLHLHHGYLSIPIDFIFSYLPLPLSFSQHWEIYRKVLRAASLEGKKKAKEARWLRGLLFLGEEVILSSPDMK